MSERIFLVIFCVALGTGGLSIAARDLFRGQAIENAQAMDQDLLETVGREVSENTRSSDLARFFDVETGWNFFVVNRSGNIVARTNSTPETSKTTDNVVNYPFYAQAAANRQGGFYDKATGFIYTFKRLDNGLLLFTEWDQDEILRPVQKIIYRSGLIIAMAMAISLILWISWSDEIPPTFARAPESPVTNVHPPVTSIPAPVPTFVSAAEQTMWYLVRDPQTGLTEGPYTVEGLRSVSGQQGFGIGQAYAYRSGDSMMVPIMQVSGVSRRQPQILLPPNAPLPPEPIQISAQPDQWYVQRDDGVIHGPFALTAITESIASGALSRTSYCWCQGMPTWIYAFQVPGLDRRQPGPPPPPIPVPAQKAS